ncbi:MAG: hypothetical protein K2X71_21375 [Methylobacterium sp.]|uniref:hypothetical protein n=1 Tax=Methylobacterium sp. TaxID=409 RepID=UPI002589CBE5|nr:hypothetical protein [Methylobacterium sp.]MBY0298556.1 hypothetical protein [Methylobacterium sp.]
MTKTLRRVVEKAAVDGMSGRRFIVTAHLVGRLPSVEVRARVPTGGAPDLRTYGDLNLRQARMLVRLLERAIEAAESAAEDAARADGTHRELAGRPTAAEAAHHAGRTKI